ncbi:efflux RND transporter permease subunit [Pueribacillus sp. YX66]|uniref:efflux RND transporter permease subunit n=1 Tax=Pueribacillus sp. YX66 TaxID=3229242 RepID=UPI00358D8679
MKLSDFSIRRPVFTIVTMVLFLLLGAVSYLNIPLKLIPDIDPPIGAVVVSYDGANPTEVVEKVTKPVEARLSTLPGLKMIQSISQEGSSLTILQFSWTTSIDDVQDEINSALNQVQVPDDAGEPRFLKFDPSQFPVIQMAISADEKNEDFENLVADLEQELNKIDGVANVDVDGIRVDEIQIALDQDKLEKYHLSQQEIVDVIQSNNISMPGSPVTNEEERLTTRVISTLTSVNDVKNLIVTKKPNGDNVTLSEVAEVKKAKEKQNIITRANEEPAVLISVLQQSDANTAEVSTLFNEGLNDLLEKEKYKDIDTAVLFDQGDFIHLAIDSVTSALIIGGLLAMIVLFLFLRNVRSPLIIGIAIPFSVIVTFVLLYFSNYSLNIMTLGGLALGIGMLVDNSIVVIESIYRHLQMGKEPKEAASIGTKEVAGAITASTLTTVAVFVPVLFIQGLIGNLFKELGFTVAFSLFASLFVALTVVPMIASRVLKAPSENVEEKRREGKILTSIEKATRWVLGHRLTVIMITLLLLVLGGLGLTTVGTQFLPATDEGFFTINVTHEHGTPLNVTEETVKSIEEVLADENDIQDFLSLIGSTTQQGPFGTPVENEAEIFVSMVDLDKRDRSTLEVSEAIKSKVERAAGDADVSFSQHGSMGSEPNTLTFFIQADTEKNLENYAAQIEEKLEDLSNVNEVTNDKSEKQEEIQITVDRKKALDEGLAPAQVASIVNHVTRGQQASQLTTEDEEVLPIFIQYDEEVIKNISSLKKLLIKKPDGTYTTLGDVTNIERADGAVSIQRSEQLPAVQFTVKYSTNTTLGDVTSDVNAEIDDLDLPDDFSMSYTGDQELLQDAMDDLALAFILAILFVYLVMAAQFESFKHPFVIIFTVPLIVIGVMIALTTTRTPLGVTAIIGLIVLAGIVVNNAIVLVDYINQKKAEGWRTYDAIVEAVKVRTRPILMTALTTILGLVPLALGIGEGAEIQQPLGITVIGGLISSTFLTLFLIPVIYSLFDKETRNLNKKYVTPDGQLIPAYLLDSQDESEVNKSEEEKKELLEIEGDELSKDDVIALLENIIDISKKKKDDE